MSSLYFRFWCYSRKWRRRISPRFNLVVFVCGVMKRIRRQEEFKITLCNRSGGNFSLGSLGVVIRYWAELHLESCQMSIWSCPAKITNGFKALTVSAEKFHHKCSTKFRLHLRLSMCGVDRLQVYGICSRRLIYNEVIEDRSNYKKSYLWWFRIFACS